MEYSSDEAGLMIQILITVNGEGYPTEFEHYNSDFDEILEKLTNFY
ncbi:hypothetical protein [Psychroflexus aestuariivivens]|nr:hypothetical protein [Psychroflexus aestuariivivens]